MKFDERTQMKISQDLIAYLDACPTAFHAVEETRNRLNDSGFTFINESDHWQLKPGGKYYSVRSDSALIAWIMGKKSPSQTGIRMIGAHTDSPGFRLKRNSTFTKTGYLQLGVEIYGGPLLASWTDRDLSIAGRVLVNDSGNIVPRLIRIQRPLLRIPQLAIHLNRKVNDDGLVLHKQNHLPPIMALIKTGQTADTESVIQKLLSEELGVGTQNILSWELELVDLQPASTGGLNNEFIFSGRIDNLAMCHAALLALLNQTKAPDTTTMIALFDNEEVGSNTVNGGASTYLRSMLERILGQEEAGRESIYRGLANSFFISADGAHAVHPNYAEMHDAQHQVQMNGGPVLKHNAQERYATDADGEAVFAAICKELNVPLQHYVHRTDLPCGSTIGPVTATNMGIRVVDVGSAMLSMHSVREICGTADPAMMTAVLTRYFDKKNLLTV